MKLVAWQSWGATVKGIKVSRVYEVTIWRLRFRFCWPPVIFEWL